MSGKTIKVFLIDGTASGLRTAEIGLSTTKAIVVPRASLPAASKRDELKRTGVYVLVGQDPDRSSRSLVYVGEGDSVLNRLIKHNSDAKKEFWEQAIVFISKDEYLTKAHIRYLEARFLELAREAKRAGVTNGTGPGAEGLLPESDGVDMEEFLRQARLLLATLGFTFLDPLRSEDVPTAEAPVSNPVFSYEGTGFQARCEFDQDAAQFILKAGSTIRKKTAESASSFTRNLREEWLEAGLLVDQDDESWRLTKDYAFSSPTGAASVVSGGSINGRIAWKLGGQTLAEWEDTRIQVDAE